MPPDDLVDEIRRNVLRFFAGRSRGEILAGDARDFAHWRDCSTLLQAIADQATELAALRVRAAQRRAPSSDDTIAMPTPATALASIPAPAQSLPDHADQFAYPAAIDADGTTIGWNACLVAAEVKVAAAIAGVVRSGGTAVEARTQTLIALRSMRRG